MKPKPKILSRSELKAIGFKPVSQHPEIWVTSNGNVYSTLTGSFLTPNSKNLIPLQQGYLSIPKAILQEFGGQKLRDKANLIYIDGNKSNLSLQNLKYSRLFEGKPTKVKESDLVTAIRCYFEVESDFKAKNSIVRIYLSKMFIESILFIKMNAKSPYFSIFSYYCLNSSSNIAAIAEFHRIGVRDCTQIINSYTNEFTGHILKRLNAGLLNLKPIYKKPKKQSSLKNALAGWRKFSLSLGNS